MKKKDFKYFDTYEKIIDVCPIVGKITNEKCYEFVSSMNKATVGKLREDWVTNIKENVDSGLWDKHGGIADDCINLCSNKAMIAVGAGPSFHKNKRVLKQITDSDGVKDWNQRDFYIVASNHMYKPLLEMHIIPDFVIIIDAGDKIYDQLNTNIPKLGKSTVLLAGIHCSPKVLKGWDEQGKDIRFYVNQTEGFKEEFEEATKEHVEKYWAIGGGNCLNSAWVFSLRFLGSSVFFGIGNDLSYPLQDTVDKQRNTYYADGDYSTNAKETGSGRDEAAANKKWLGINKIEKRKIIIPGRSPSASMYDIELDPVGTSPTLWVYKTWVETQVGINMQTPRPFHYYNCTEGGILGVLNNDPEYSDEGLKDQSKWSLLDDICPRWHTARLEDAAEQFLTAKRELWQREIQTDARLVTT